MRELRKSIPAVESDEGVGLGDEDVDAEIHFVFVNLQKGLVVLLDDVRLDRCDLKEGVGDYGVASAGT